MRTSKTARLYPLAQLTPAYPSDGTYYVYNVQFKRFFNNKDLVNAEGNLILGWLLTPERFTNQQFIINNAAPDGQRVTTQVLGTEEVDPSGGFVHVDSSNGKLVNSATADSWSLQPVLGQATQFLILEDDLAITLDNGTTFNANDAGAQLSVEVIKISALNQRWVFVPDDQIDTYSSRRTTSLSMDESGAPHRISSEKHNLPVRIAVSVIGYR